jgi:excisionase family DNA binding protein
MVELEKYMSVKGYAELKGISVQAVYQAVKRKTLESKKLGSIVLIKKD